MPTDDARISRPRVRRKAKRDAFWAIEWRSKNRLDGERRHLQWDGELRLYRTRREAREFINEWYGYIQHRADLRAEPHGWRMPVAVRVVVERAR